MIILSPLIYKYMSLAKVTGMRVLQQRQSAAQFISGNNEYFNQKVQSLIGRDFTAIKQLGIFEFSTNPVPNIFYYHAVRYDSKQHQQIEDFIISEIQRFQNNNDNSFAIGYIHAGFTDFLAFRKILERWPRHFVQKIRKVYIIGASFMVKLIETFSFGTFPRLCDELFMNLENMEEVQGQDEAVMRFIGEDPKQVTGKGKKAYKDSIKIIESDLYGKEIKQYELHSGKYPVIILQLLRRILANPKELQTEGIFRKNCDMDELQRLQHQISGKKEGAIDNQSDILVVCGCLKKILNNLRLPLFNYGIYNHIIAFTGGDETELIKKILSQMEYVNNKVFILLAVFLKEYIISEQESNKMSGYNLAVVFGPCFFRPEVYDLKDLIYSGKFAKILISCFDQQETLFDPAERALAAGILQELKNGTLRP